MLPRRHTKKSIFIVTSALVNSNKGISINISDSDLVGTLAMDIMGIFTCNYTGVDWPGWKNTLFYQVVTVR